MLTAAGAVGEEYVHSPVIVSWRGGERVFLPTQKQEMCGRVPGTAFVP